jgi:glycerol uptake facilitator-like aquaporin
VFNKLGRFDGLSDEMRTIVLGTLKEFPREQIEGAIAGTVKQLISVGTGEGVVNSVWHTYAIMSRYTPSVVPAMQAARQQQGQISLQLLNRIHIPIALLFLVLLPLWITLGLRRSASADFSRLAMTVTVAVLINAAVCGGLSNPHDRYGARIIWLAGMVGLLGIVRMVEVRRQPAINLGVPAASPARPL